MEYLTRANLLLRSWQAREIRDFEFMTGQQEIINELTDRLIKLEQQVVKLKAENEKFIEDITDLGIENIKLKEALKLCEKALYESHDRVDVMNMPPHLPDALQVCSFILRGDK